MKHSVVCTAILLVLWLLPVQAIEPHLLQKADPQKMEQWTDSVFNTLTPDERIAQLFVITVRNSDTPQNRQSLKRLVQELKIGGLLFDAGTATDQATLTNYCQSLARVPLLITLDGEWGLAMRLSDTPRFPVNMMLGAIQNDSLLYEYGRAVGRQCRRMGIQVNFAPVLDVNSNPRNPVIGKRSFGQGLDNVSTKAIAYARGLEAEGVMAVAKHFPGHGDTSEDSHKTLPLVPHSRERLMQVEIAPFKRYIDSGLSGLMVGHLNIPALDDSGRPASLSRAITHDLLGDSLQFEGLVFTDALKMKGASTFGNTALLAIQAGNDIVLNPLKPEAQLKAIREAIDQGKISQSLIDEKCKKVLRYKYALGLARQKSVDLEGLTADLNAPRYEALNRRLNAEALTLLHNRHHTLPITHLDKSRIAVVSVGSDTKSVFQTTTKLYAPQPGQFDDSTDLTVLLDTLRHYDRVIVAIHSDKTQYRARIGRLCQTGKAIAVCFLSPYQMNRLSHELAHNRALLLAYEDTPLAQEYAAQALFGGCAIRGKLPVKLEGSFDEGDGLRTEKCRLGYTLPESVGMDSRVLSKVDSIIAEGIAHKAFPGCQLVVARQGEVVWNKAYGYFDYETHAHPVATDDLYDLASVSKVTGTLPAVMKACDDGDIVLEKPMSHYFAPLRNSDKKDLTLRQALLHETGMRPSLQVSAILIDPQSFTPPLFNRRKDATYSIPIDGCTFGNRNARLRSDLLSTRQSAQYPIQIAHDLYGYASLPDTLIARIIDTKLRPTKRYLYSCLNFILLKETVESATGIAMDRYLQKHIYGPLGMGTTGYCPATRFPIERIAPTENDLFYRHQQLDGYVHDETAAFFGGVQGNAGLFSSTNDLAKLCQMWLNHGSYGGEQILSPETVHRFMTEKSATSRRGLGFDKPDTKEPDKSPTALEASPATVGHLGFTGTCFWIDPEQQLIYIFLCNRVYPSRLHNALSELNIRPELFSVIYNSIEDYSK